MKKILLPVSILIILTLNSCKPTMYLGDYGQQNQTQVVIKDANFKSLGSFTGEARSRKNAATIKNKGGVMARAKADLLLNAKNAGVELTGSRILTNITTDVIQNHKHVKVVISAEIIEFTK